MPLNQRVQAGYGDIYVVPTAHTDRLLANFDAQRKAEQAKNDAALKGIDDTFAKNLVGVRDADIPELTKRYAAYKQIAKNNIKNKKGVSSDDNLAELKAQADVMDIAAKSKAQKEQEKLHYTNLTKTPDNYEDDAPQGIHKIMSTPVLSLGDGDAFEPYVFKGVKSISPQILKAVGQPKPIAVDLEEVGKDGYKVKGMVLRSNTPQVIASGLKSQFLSGTQEERRAVKSYNLVPQATKDQVNQQYELLKADPKIAKLWDNQVELPIAITPTDEAINFFTKQAAILQQPKVLSQERVEDAKFKAQRLNAEALAKQSRSIQAAADRQERGIANSRKNGITEEDVNTYLNDSMDGLDATKKALVRKGTNQVIKGFYELTPFGAVATALGNPDKTLWDDKNKSYHIIHYKKTKDANQNETILTDNNGNNLIESEVVATPLQVIQQLGGGTKAKRILGKNTTSAVQEASDKAKGTQQAPKTETKSKWDKYKK
jgi:hypothetical protein